MRTRIGSAALGALALVVSSCSDGVGPAAVSAPSAPQLAIGADAAADGPTLIITEVMADPAGTVSDAAGEWFEVYNPGSERVSLDGWQILSNNAAETHTIDAEVAIEPGSYAVLGNNANAATNGGVVVTYQYPAGFQLANSNVAERIELRDENGRIVDLVTFGRGALAGRSFMLRLPQCDNAVIVNNPNWVPTSSAAGSPYLYFASNFGTPGVANDSKGSLGACAGGDGVVGPLDVLAVNGAATVNGGATITLTATATDADGDGVTAGAVTWSDGDSPLVTLTPTGARTVTVAGDAVGGPATVAATLTVGDVTRTATFQVTVAQAPIPGGSARISITGFNRAPLPIGFEDQLYARVFDANNAELTSMAVTWSTSTPGIASIDPANGLVRGLAAGRALLVARTADGFERTAFVDVAEALPATTAAYGNNVEFGRPVDATPDDEFIVTWPQFVSSYNRNRGQPNWIAYNLEATHRGPAERCDCFTADPSLPAEFPRLTTDDYVGSTYSRGHMTMSEDRTAGGSSTTSSLDNARTFYFSNIIPQKAANNGGPWLNLEIHLGNLATGGTKEIYIIAGGAKYQGTLNNAGKIAIPTRTWKVAVIMPRNQGLANVDGVEDVEVIAVDMPNTETVPFSRWQDYAVTVDSVEALTGYDLLALLPDRVERAVESNTRPPLAEAGGPHVSTEGARLTLSGANSSATNGALTYAWQFGDGGSSTLVSPTHTYAQDGAYTVRLIVTDEKALADTVTTTATISNVAPTVTFGGALGLLPGETYAAAGSFADPGADAWTATVDYKDGTGAAALPLTGKSFALSHRYTTPGSYAVAVRVADDDDAGTGTAAVTVLTAQAAIDVALGLVNDLAGSRAINGGIATAFRAKLSAAQASVNRDDPAAALPELRSLVAELDSLVADRRLTSADAAPLRAYALRIIASLSR